MKTSGIGGQAVIEGIMMKNKDVYSVAVRKPDGEIEVQISNYESVVKNKKIREIPFLRGVINFIDSLILGMKTLTFSASFYEDEEEEKKEEKKETKQSIFDRVFQERGESILMGLTVAFSVVMAVAIFMILPYFISNLFRKVIVSDMLLAIAEGVIRLLIFIGYILLISRMKDIQRVFQYHGAEHKCINCIEHGLELNTKNVRKSSKQHKRCGTSFLFIVMVISIIFFMFIRVEEPALRVLVRVLLVPVIAGVSYEFLRLAGRSESKVMDILSKPGMMLQGLTTKEPDRKMMQVAIAAVEAVFDWRAFQQENGIAQWSPEDLEDETDEDWELE